MSGPTTRTLNAIEYLATHLGGVTLSAFAEALGLPSSGAHRLLNELVQCGYVRQARSHGGYVLTTKLASLGLGYLSNTGVPGIAQPVLNRLAQDSGELVRLGVIEGDRIVYLAKAQGARAGLRYDPDMGAEARLSCASAGYAWFMTLSDDRAVELVMRQGFGPTEQLGPCAPRDIRSVLAHIEATRKRGYAVMVDSFMPAMSAMAVPVARAGQPVMGTLSIAGPSSRMNGERIAALAPLLFAAADELAVSGALALAGEN